MGVQTVEQAGGLAPRCDAVPGGAEESFADRAVAEAGDDMLAAEDGGEQPHFIGRFPLAPGHSLPEKLKVYRRPQGLSRKELAGRLGVDESTVGRWERGRCDPWREPLKRAQTLP